MSDELLSKLAIAVDKALMADPEDSMAGDCLRVVRWVLKALDREGYAVVPSGPGTRSGASTTNRLCGSGLCA